eukprot:CAMPEP_0198317508 /NCGR_PEP_ID=MMETSP1450-20131203/6979_1 /TAXON_ID=753684 ORGANISM="Madagascaria erythrocladiodes, Strain CCMP3234" /NCGR_SAMPLE_ID=MMETSP1450 /ASSEMBLY_ACC=CAM_ASM_001115 /LENGTH=740 /DNA_ID=CAMNT_0044020719 /DNA_START=29 /DNA_END=2251 /DNA_ORIENTATION=-
METSENDDEKDDVHTSITLSLKAVVDHNYLGTIQEAVRDVAIVTRLARLAWMLEKTQRAQNVLEMVCAGGTPPPVGRDVRRHIMHIFQELTSVRGVAFSKRSPLSSHLRSICARLREECPRKVCRSRINPMLELASTEMAARITKALASNFVPRLRYFFKSLGLDDSSIDSAVETSLFWTDEPSSTNVHAQTFRKILEPIALADLKKDYDPPAALEDFAVSAEELLALDVVEPHPPKRRRLADGAYAHPDAAEPEEDFDDDIVDPDFVPGAPCAADMTMRGTFESEEGLPPPPSVAATRPRRSCCTVVDDEDLDPTFKPCKPVNEAFIKANMQHVDSFYAVLHYVNRHLFLKQKQVKKRFTIKPLGILGKSETVPYARFDKRSLEYLRLPTDWGYLLPNLYARLNKNSATFGVEGCNSFVTNGYGLSVTLKVPPKEGGAPSVPKNRYFEDWLRESERIVPDGIVALDPGNRDLFHAHAVDSVGASKGTKKMTGPQWRHETGYTHYQSMMKKKAYKGEWTSLREVEDFAALENACLQRARDIPVALEHAMSNNSRKYLFNYKKKTMSRIMKLPKEIMTWAQKSIGSRDVLLAYGDYTNPSSCSISGRMPVKRLFSTLKISLKARCCLADEYGTSRDCPDDGTELVRARVHAKCAPLYDKESTDATCRFCKFAFQGPSYSYNVKLLRRRICPGRFTDSWVTKHCPTCKATMHRDVSGSLGIARKALKKLIDIKANGNMTLLH